MGLKFGAPTKAHQKSANPLKLEWDTCGKKGSLVATLVDDELGTWNFEIRCVSFFGADLRRAWRVCRNHDDGCSPGWSDCGGEEASEELALARLEKVFRALVAKLVVLKQS